MADLVDVYEAIRGDKAFDALRAQPGVRLVPGVGASRPAVMIVGEAPGATENTKGVPFVGASGVLLRRCMAQAGLSVNWTGKQTGAIVPPGCAEGVPPNAFITNVIKYRPPGNRTPTIPEIEAARKYLRGEWSAVGRPPVIVAVGGVAKIAFMPEAGAVSALVGRPHVLSDGRTTLWVMYHPAFILRQRPDGPIVDKYVTHWEELGQWLQTTSAHT